MPTDTRAWSGSFTGADSLAGSFGGSWSHGSAGVEWSGSFELTRE
jgi:hypothetical protein